MRRERRGGGGGQERQPEQREQGTRMERMGERAHGRQRQQRGWPGQSAPSLPGARATPAQPVSGGGCLLQPRWAVCATGAGAHQGQTSREGEKDIWWRDSAWRNKAPGPHAHRNTARQAMDGLWTEARGQQKQSNDPGSNQHHPQYANYWAPLTRKRHTMPQSAQPYWAPRTRKRHQQEHRPQRPPESSDPTQHVKGTTGDCPGPRKGTTIRRNVTQGGRVSVGVLPSFPGRRGTVGLWSCIAYPCPDPRGNGPPVPVPSGTASCATSLCSWNSGAESSHVQFASSNRCCRSCCSCFSRLHCLGHEANSFPVNCLLPWTLGCRSAVISACPLPAPTTIAGC